MIKWFKYYKAHQHTIKKWFWRANYPVAFALFFWTNEKVLLMYTLLCSVYANEETSAGAAEARSDGD